MYEVFLHDLMNTKITLIETNEVLIRLNERYLYFGWVKLGGDLTLSMTNQSSLSQKVLLKKEFF